MTVHEHLTTFHGLPVADFGQSEAAAGDVAWRLWVEVYEADEPFADVWQRFLATVDTKSVTALVIGPWGEVYDTATATAVVELLVAAKDRFPLLTGIFLGDIVGEESEISWIKQGDVTPLLQEFPKLTELGVRGGDELKLQPVRHEQLRTLSFQSGGLPGHVVRAVAESDLPALRDLRLWLGVHEYGANWRLPDLAPIVDGKKFGELRYLGLQNSDKQNDVARLVAGAEVVRQLSTLDLSMGALTDEGGEALLAGQQQLTSLKTLDLTHHFLSDDMMQRLRDAFEPAGVQMILDGQEAPDVYEDDTYYYTAVSE